MITTGDGVSVITVTRGRPELLRRAIESVAGQDYCGPLEHLIVIDDCQRTYDAVSAWATTAPALRVHLIRRTEDAPAGPPQRLSRLRNHAVALADTPWIAFLDDDNEYESFHIRRLIEHAWRSGAEAVHSHRRLFHLDGRPYLDPCWPWARSRNAGEQRWRELVNLGLLEPGSNIMRDRADARPAPHGVMEIDTNVWLIRADLLRRLPIPDRYHHTDWDMILVEDDKMLENFIAHGVVPASNDVVSVRYYLGGYSNNLKADTPHSDVWRRW